MTSSRRWSRLALGALLTLSAFGCDAGPIGVTPESTAPVTSATPDPGPSTYAREPVEGEEPAQQKQITGSSSVSTTLPFLTEETGVTAYLTETLRINMAVLKSPQAQEVMPVLVPVKTKKPCFKNVDAAKRGNAANAPYKVGDKASASSPLLTACIKNGKLAFYYAPSKFYQFHLNRNVPQVHELVIRAVGDYLAQLTRNKWGVADGGYYSECALGRLIGGLRDKDYVSEYWAGAQEVDGEVDTEGEKVYVTARDQGWCSNVWLGISAPPLGT
jgi:hypothetical protein